jgi:HlyD family secretion protein
MPESETPGFRKKTKKWVWVSLLLLVALAVATAVMLPFGSNRPTIAISAAPDKPIGVGARGRIEPQDGVMLVAAPYFSGRPSIVSEIRVKEGDSIRVGQILAVLDSFATLEKALHQSEAEVEVARTRLALVKAGAKPADLETLRADIARWESEYQTSVSDVQRYEKLHQNQIIPTADLEQKRLAMERAKRTLDGAKERLKSLEEVRKEDVDVRAAELASSLAQVERARAEMERMIVRAPTNGKVLKIHAYPGEEVGPQGILELGKTNQMYVVAEVYETDISRVRVGQKAEISGDLLAQPLNGAVTQIESQISKSELLPTDTASFADSRVIKVKIKLDNGEDAVGLIYGKVEVLIKP